MPCQSERATVGRRRHGPKEGRIVRLLHPSRPFSKGHTGHLGRPTTSGESHGRDSHNRTLDETNELPAAGKPTAAAPAPIARLEEVDSW